MKRENQEKIHNDEKKDFFVELLIVLGLFVGTLIVIALALTYLFLLWGYSKPIM